MYFRSMAILGLPVSNTSYSRHAVSTIQSPINTADNGRSLIDTDGTKTPRNPVLLPYLHILIISGPVSILHSFRIKFTTHVLEHEYILYLASNRKLLDFYTSYISQVTRDHLSSTGNR